MTLDQTMDFWLKMKVVNGCWEWQRSLMSVGYGQVWVPAWKKMTGAHRTLIFTDSCFFTAIMKIANPVKMSRRKHPQEHLRKITSETAVEIRRLREGGMKLQEIGQMFGLASGQVSRIAKGERWASA